MKLPFQLNGRLAFILASVVSIVFIGLSAYLIISVGKLEEEAALHSEDIRVLNAIQNSTFDVYSSLNEGKVPNWIALSDAYDKLADQTLRDEELEALTDMILEIKVIADRQRQIDIEPLKEKLAKLIHYSNDLLEENRSRLNMINMKQDEYWSLTILCLIFACIISLVLIYSSYRSSRSNRLLVEVKNRNSRIFNQALNCIIISDVNGRITEFNTAAEELFGYTNEEVIGKSFDSLFRSKSDLKRVKESFEEEGQFMGEVVNQRKDGTEFVSFLSANLLYDSEGNQSGSIGISRDITKQKEKEQEYENILDNATDIILTTDLKGDCTFINDAGRVQLGYQYREMIGKSIKDFIYNEDLADVIAFYQHQFEQKTPETYLEFRVKKKNGDVIWVGQIAKLLPSPTNKSHFVGVQGIVRNIDERKRAQNKLRKREASYRELFENTSELIHSMDQKGNLLFCNESWKEKLGYGEAEVEKLNFFKILSNAQEKELSSLIEELHDEKSKEERSIKLSVKAKDGNELKLDAVVSESQNGEESSTIQMFMRDATEEVQVKEELGITEANLKLLTESIDDLFYLWNKEKDEYEYISKSSKEILGLPPSKFKKAHEFEDKFLHPKDLPSYQSARKKLDKGENFDLDYRIIVNDKVKWINEKIFPIKDKKGKIHLHSGVMRDISQTVNSIETIEQQTAEIGKSLSYAERMQENMIIELKQLRQEMPGMYVFFQPKEKISGDFFIAEKMTNRSNEDIILLAVADCTGNGVPAGMLSFLCNSLLKESFLSSEVKSPADALEYVRERLLSLFKFHESEYVYDAMHISLCLINPEKSELEYAGAVQPLFLLRNEQIMEIKGSRQHVGYNYKTEPFKNHKLTLNVGDSIYLFTDGFYTQFGGEDGKKLLKRRMMDFLLTISHLEAKEQKQKLSEFFSDWKGSYDQIDDVTVACYQV